MECLGNVGGEAPALSSLLLTLDELREPGELSDDSGFMLFPQFCPKSCLCAVEREGCAIFCRVRLVFTVSPESSQTQGENVCFRSHWLILAGKQDLKSSEVVREGKEEKSEH